MGHRTSRQNHHPEGSEEQKEEIVPLNPFLSLCKG